MFLLLRLLHCVGEVLKTPLVEYGGSRLMGWLQLSPVGTGGPGIIGVFIIGWMGVCMYYHQLGWVLCYE